MHQFWHLLPAAACALAAAGLAITAESDLRAGLITWRSADLAKSATLAAVFAAVFAAASAVSILAAVAT